jgi:hypothetical protein
MPNYILSAPPGTPEEAVEEIERRQYEIEKKLKIIMGLLLILIQLYQLTRTIPKYILQERI